MSLKDDVQRRLIVEIISGLDEVKIENDWRPVRSTLKWCAKIDEWLPDDVKNRLKRFCGGEGLYTFISDEIRRIIESTYDFDGDADDKPISAYPEFSNRMAFAKNLVERIGKIPFRYRVTVGLPATFSKHIVTFVKETKLSETISLCAGDSIPKPFPFASPNSRLDSGLFNDIFTNKKFEKEINSERVYFTYVTLGYAGTVGSGKLARELEDNLRAFYGACKAIGLIAGADWSNANDHAGQAVIIHREDKDRPIIATEDVESDLVEKIYFLSTKEFMELNSSALLADYLGQTAYIFRKDGYSQRLHTACIWYFRASVSQRPLDKLLEATIAIEVMLGDKQVADGVGLSRLLGNRCAYMLGKSQDERIAIQKSFDELYKLRSDIVHVGKHRVAENEVRVVEEAVRLCGRIISHELGAMSDADDDVPF